MGQPVVHVASIVAHTSTAIAMLSNAKHSDGMSCTFVFTATFIEAGEGGA